MSFLGMLDKTKQDSKNCKKAINNHLKKISQYFILRFLVIAFLFSTINFSFTVVNAQSTEMENRETVYYPSDETGTSMSEFMNVPNTPEQNASMSGNTLTLTTGIANGGYAKSQTQINLAEQDYVWVFNYQAPSNGVSIAARDGGVAFTLHNDPGFVSEEDGDYGALGIYRLLDKNKNVNNEGIKNAVTVEFDNCNYSQPYVASYVWKQNFDAALKYGDYRPHIAITNPQGISPTNDEIPHEALSLLTSPIWNNSNNTIRISWSLTDAGNSNDKTDNIYTLKYEYYQGSSTVTANPTATGTKTFTYNEMIERFGGEMVYFSLSGSTGVVARTQTISAIQTYPYEVNYYVQLADGTKTLNKVPGISPNPKTGKLPAGINNIGPLPNVAKYVVVPGQNTNVNITSSATADVFNYYYIDDAPVINGADDKEIFIGESFDPLAGVTANDDEDGSITLTAGNVIGSVNTQQADSYTLTYTVIDSAGNKTIVYRNITVKNRKLILHSGSSNTTHTQIVNNPTAINLDSIDTSSTGAFYLDGSDFWGWTITEGNTTPDYLNESSNISTDKYLYNGTLNVPVEKLGTPDANGDYHLYAVYAPKITVTVKKTWEGSARPDSIWVALFVRTSLYAEEVSPWTGVATYYYVENSTQQITDYDSTITWDNLPYVDSNGLRLTYIVTEGTTEELAKKGGGSFEVEIFTTTINGVSREVRADKLVNGSDVYVLQTLAEQQKNASGITTGYDFPIYKNILVKIDAPNIATVFEQETSLKINLPAEGSNTLK